MSQTPDTNRLWSWRWLPIGLFAAAGLLNYLDRQVLAAAAPLVKSDFGLSNVEYGQLISVFSLVYAAATPLAGLLIDRFGLPIASSVAVLFWSAAGISSGLASDFRGLLASRIALAIGESAAIPASTKATAVYLESRELGLGTAVQSIGITAGMMLAPLLLALVAPTFGWRAAFVAGGALGLVWVPVWLIASRRMPGRAEAPAAGPSPSRLPIGDRRLWGAAVANALVMAVYSLWMNWTTVYFVEARHLTLVEANRQFAWIPPVFATLGGFAGGWLAFRGIRQAGDGVAARLRVCWACAPILLLTAAVPFLPSTTLAAGAMAVSFFACVAIANNVQMIPIDLFGRSCAAFTASVLTCSFALMQALVSPAIGWLVDRYGFGAVCLPMSVLPLCGVAILALAVRREAAAVVPAVLAA